ncbi:MAG: DUF1080 domain-containing protein [Opitutales bacterium]|nr:DUF1080 domain-containing protein [Opitutales bacterium]
MRTGQFTPIILFIATLSGCVTNSSLIRQNNLKGWKTLNDGEWTVENGVIFGTKDAAVDKHCLLISEREFDDFQLSLEYNSIKGNSGFYFRLAPADNPLGLKGYHAEIDSKGSNAGGLYDVAVEWLFKPDKALIEKAFKPGKWNKMTIKAIGRNITVSLNGHEMSSITNDRSNRGSLGVQLHANENTQIKLKNIRITEL